MYKGSLFERLSPYEYQNINSKSVEAYYASIANNLSRIFSTNAGSAQILNDYGKPDLNNINLSMKESIERIENECEKTINKYEPRLFRTRVRVNKESLNSNKLEVLIDGILRVDNKQEHLIFKANLLNNGKTQIYKEI